MGPIPKSKTAAVIVAHPDDETLWAGGLILSQPSWHWFVVTLCRSSDTDRAPRFYDAMNRLGATGAMADLDDSPEQIPLPDTEIQATILELLAQRPFDLILTHNPAGEYTRHRRHEEIGKAIITLWQLGRISTDELWVFAYEDGSKKYLPRPIEKAHMYYMIPQKLWQKKYGIVTSTYGFEPNSFEAQTTPRAEAFWIFSKSWEAKRWLDNEVFQHESSTAI